MKKNRNATAVFIAVALMTMMWVVSDARADEDPLAGAVVLDRTMLIRATLDRNPEIEAMRQAWLAMREMRAQVVSLDDPMVGVSLAPLSVFSNDVRFGAGVEYAQMLPWPGKRTIRGTIADANARAMFGDYETARLEMAKMASDLFDEYRVNERAIEIVHHHTALLEDLKGSAESRYVVGDASQQDPLEAEVMIADLMRQEEVLVGRRNILAAEINTLLHRDPRAPLPPVPATVAIPDLPAESVDELIAMALAARPELATLDARVEAAAASTELMKKEFRPDFKVMGQYSSMWMETEHQWMAGVSINLPIRTGKLEAAVRESEAKTEEQRATHRRIEDKIRLDVVRAMENIQRAKRIVEILRDRIVPASRDQVEAARVGFENGMNPFTSLVLAENRLRDASLEYEIAIADLYRSLAELARATGRLPFLQNISVGGNQS